MMNEVLMNNEYDVLVVGGGIAGMESSLSLAEMGMKVCLVEKEPSIGGKMILLSKVFPTLDCASCISTPKMGEVSHHPNIDMKVYSEVEGIEKDEDGNFVATVYHKPTYVDPAKCTGCSDCERACTVGIPDEYNFDMGSRRAAHIAFPQAIPKKAVISCSGISPCSATCPAGVKPHGYVSLVRNGRWDEAFHLHMEDVPLVGSLSRACYAPCEGECTRTDVDGSVPIRGIKRTMADAYYRKFAEPEYGPVEDRKGKKIAVVGSGPSGLTASYHLAREGYDVKIFEEKTVSGGMLRLAIPEFRLPGYIVDRDIKNITALGVEIETSSPVTSVKKLKDDGFDAVYIAAGAKEPRYMGIEGEDLAGVMDCMTFLEHVNCGDAHDLTGKTVVVIGGGNSAMDPARSAIRLGAKEVHIMYRRSLGEMPAHDFEIKAAQEEGVNLELLTNPVRFMGENGKLNALECIKMELGEADDSGRRRPIPIEGSEATINPDLVVLAIGLSPTTTHFGKELDLNRNGTIVSDERTLLTGLDSVFAGGDVATGPSMIVNACGQGRRAAFFIDKQLSGADLSKEVFFMDEERQLAEKQKVLSKIADLADRPAKELPELPAKEAIKSFTSTEHTMTKAEAQYGASRCLDCGDCCKCGECIKACPADAIDLNAKGRTEKYKASSVIVSTGFDLFKAEKKPLLKYNELSNVITSMQMDRLLAPTRPYNSLIRPSDGKIPQNVAFVLCTGSRDHKAGNRLCSRVCCMYSIKQAQLVMGTLPLADVTIYYIDIRAFGKGFEEFYQQSIDMDVEYVKGKIAAIEDGKDGSVVVQYEDFAEGKGMVKREHDLVVLSVGMLANQEYNSLFKGLNLEADEYEFVNEVSENLNPGKTSIEGVFVAGTAAGSRDIPDTILHSGAAASQAAVYVVQRRKSNDK